MNKDKKRLTQKLPFVLLGVTFLIILGFGIYYKHVYDKGHEFVYDQTNTEGGSRYSQNVNVMLNRPDNWHQIITEESKKKLNLSQRDFEHIDGSTATIPITAELARQFCGIDDSAVTAYVDHNTTGTAYDSLIHRDNGKSLIIVTEPSDEELNDAKLAGVELDVTPVALDGFVFITHKDNPVDSLTVEQIQKIYTGEITNWKEVGGKNEKIVPYQREKNSGSQTAMENIVMQGIPMMKPAESYQEITTMGMLIDYVSAYYNDECSLGYTFYYYINNLYRSEDIKVIKVNGISPDNENLIDKSYPFSSAYYAVTLKGASERADEIRDYLVSDEGQEIIKLAGYCPVR